MSALLLIPVVVACIIGYLWLGMRFAIPAYRRRLTREIDKYRQRYDSLVRSERGVDYRFCQTMAERGLIWPHIAFWPVVEAARLIQHRIDEKVGDPRDLDPVYLQQRIADLERELGVRP